MSTKFQMPIFTSQRYDVGKNLKMGHVTRPGFYEVVLLLISQTTTSVRSSYVLTFKTVASGLHPFKDRKKDPKFTNM